MTDRDRPQPHPPLPPSNFNRDQLLRWLSQQTVSAQKLITGSLQADQTISSSNFSSGSAGWEIQGSGDAEFNSVTVRGDIVSSNWDGADPANLSSEDGTATAGFYLDSSAGAAQFEGDLFVNGTVNITADDSTFVLKSTSGVGANTRIDSWVDPVGLGWSWLRESDDVEMARIHANNAGTLFVQSTSDTDSASIWIGEIDTLSGFGTRIHKGLKIQSGGTNYYLEANRFRVTNDGVTVNDIGSASSPGYSFQGDTDTGIYKVGVNTIGFATNGVLRARIANDSLRVMDGTASVPSLSFIDDTNTGIYRDTTDSVSIAAGGTQALVVRSGLVASSVINGDTTSSAANVTVGATGNRLQRSTSSLKYKPDWRPAPEAADYGLPTPIKWTDEKGQLRLGFGAEHVHEAVPEAYEEEIYDLRSLVAILSEKIKRLERTLGRGNNEPPGSLS